MPIYALDDHQPSLPGAGRFWIAPDAHVIGRVTLGDEVGVWFGVVIRGDSEPIVIGKRCAIESHIDRRRIVPALMAYFWALPSRKSA